MDLEILDISNLDWNDNERVEKLGMVSNKILIRTFYINHFNSRSESQCIKWGHTNFFCCLFSWGRSRGVENIDMKFC